MVYSREVHFDKGCPSIEDIIDRVSLRTGIHPIYLAEKWLLVNPLDWEDIFSLYQVGEDHIVLTNEGSITDLLMATLYALLNMGGYYTDWAG